jgi:hypothetical protein
VPSQSPRGKWWGSMIRTCAPLSVSLAALVVSTLAYVDQHKSDNAAIIAKQESYARRVSFWLANNPRKPVPLLLIQNRSDAPISDVVVKLGINDGNRNIVDTMLPVGTIPPCSLDKISWSKFAQQNTGPHITIQGESLPLSPEQITFTDADAVTWTRFWDGSLEKQRHGSTLGSLVGQSVTRFSSITTVNGCS